MEHGSKAEAHRDVQTIIKGRQTNQYGPQKGRQPVKSGLTQGIKLIFNPVSGLLLCIAAHHPNPFHWHPNKSLLPPILCLSRSFYQHTASQL